MHWGVAVAIVIAIVIVIGLVVWYKYRGDPEPTTSERKPFPRFPGAPDLADLEAPFNNKSAAETMTRRCGKLMSVDPKDDTVFGQLMLLQMPEWEMRETCGYLPRGEKIYVTVKTITVNGIQYEADADQCVTKLCHGDVIEGLPGQTQQYKLIIMGDQE